MLGSGRGNAHADATAAHAFAVDEAESAAARVIAATSFEPGHREWAETAIAGAFTRMRRDPVLAVRSDDAVVTTVVMRRDSRPPDTRERWSLHDVIERCRPAGEHWSVAARLCSGTSGDTPGEEPGTVRFFFPDVAATGELALQFAQAMLAEHAEEPAATPTGATATDGDVGRASARRHIWRRWL